MTTFFDAIPSSLKQTFSRIRRTSGGVADSYGDATFTEQTTSGYKGFFQWGQRVGVSIVLAGREIAYDAIVYTGATTLVAENDVIVFGKSTSTSVATRYRISGIQSVYEKNAVEHKEFYVKQEVT